MAKTRKSAVWPLVVLLLSGSSQAASQAVSARDLAEAQVKWQPCNASENVDAHLSQKTRHSQRDLGWRVFDSDDGGFDVERAFMASKAMEIRYRWHVNGQGSIWPVNRRAEELCS